MNTSVSQLPATAVQCSTCGGEGWVYLDVPYDHPAFGQLVPCLACRYDEALAEALHHCGLDAVPPALHAIIPASDAQRVALEALRRTLERGYGFVYLWGNFGTGKTFLAEAALRTWVEAHLQDRHGEADYWVLPDLMARFRQAVKNGEVQRLQKRLQRLDLLVLDEVDKVHSTSFAREQLFTLIDQRYRRIRQKRRGITIFTANVPPEKAAPEPNGGYFASRVRQKGFFVVPFPGDDLRTRFPV